MKKRCRKRIIKSKRIFKKRDTFKKDNKKEKPRKNIHSINRTKNENVQKQTKTHKNTFFGQVQRERPNMHQTYKFVNISNKKAQKRLFERCRSFRKSF